MIAAAKADGHIDDEERKKIGDRSACPASAPEAEAFLLDELEKPLDLDELVVARPDRGAEASSSTPPRG